MLQAAGDALPTAETGVKCVLLSSVALSVTGLLCGLGIVSITFKQVGWLLKTI